MQFQVKLKENFTVNLRTQQQVKQTIATTIKVSKELKSANKKTNLM